MAKQVSELIILRKFISWPILVVAGQQFLSLAQETARRTKGQASAATFLRDLVEPDFLSVRSSLPGTACCCLKQGHRHMTNCIRPRIFCNAFWLLAVKRLFTTVLLLVLLLTTTLAEPLILQGRVVRVTDGDTVTLLDEHEALHKIRLAGIDAPESAMPYGHQATLYLASLVFGENVEAVTYKQDRYGRTVATLMHGEQDINLAMLQAGLAWHYKHYAKEQPAAQALAYAQAEELARTQNLALWKDSDPCAPWDWRKSRRPRPPQSAGAIMPGELAMSTGTNP